MASITRFIEKRLRLEVNQAKSAVAKPSDRHFLGFSLNRNEKGEVEINLSERSKARIRERSKELSPRNWGDTMKSAITGLNGYLQGWMGFFGICTSGVEQFLNGVDVHIRRRLRAIKLKQWKWRLTMLRRLVKLGAKQQSAGRQLYDGLKGIWKLSHTSVVNRTLNNAYWLKEGLRPSAELWKESKLRATFSAPKQMELCLS